MWVAPRNFEDWWLQHWPLKNRLGKFLQSSITELHVHCLIVLKFHTLVKCESPEAAGLFNLPVRAVAPQRGYIKGLILAVLG